MTSIPVEASPAEQKPQTQSDLVSELYFTAAEKLGVKRDDASTLGLLLLGSVVLNIDTAQLLTGGRAFCAELLEQGLRSGPDGLVVHRKGRQKNIDDSIALVVEAAFPTPKKTVRNEVALNGCVVWFDPTDETYWVEAPESRPRQVMSAAAACTLCDSGASADALFAEVRALQEKPTVVVALDDPRSASDLQSAV